MKLIDLNIRGKKIEFTVLSNNEIFEQLHKEKVYFKFRYLIVSEVYFFHSIFFYKVKRRQQYCHNLRSPFFKRHFSELHITFSMFVRSTKGAFEEAQLPINTVLSAVLLIFNNQFAFRSKIHTHLHLYLSPSFQYNQI